MAGLVATHVELDPRELALAYPDDGGARVLDLRLRPVWTGDLPDEDQRAVAGVLERLDLDPVGVERAEPVLPGGDEPVNALELEPDRRARANHRDLEIRPAQMLEGGELIAKRTLLQLSDGVLVRECRPKRSGHLQCLRHAASIPQGLA